MKQEVEYNLQPNNLDNVVQVNLANNAVNNAVNNTVNNVENADNPNQVGALLEEGSDNVLSANNTEHFLSVENALEIRIMFLLCKLYARNPDLKTMLN